MTRSSTFRFMQAATVAAAAMLLVSCSPRTESSASSEVLSDEAFTAIIANTEMPVLVDFWATWCGPCIAMKPVIESFAEQNKGRIEVVKVDVDANPHLAKRFQIRAVPTLILYQNGKAVAAHPGAMNERKLASWVAENTGVKPDGPG